MLGFGMGLNRGGRPPSANLAKLAAGAMDGTALANQGVVNNGLTGWYGSTTGTLSMDSGAVKNTGNGTANTTQSIYATNFPATVGRKVFMKCKIKSLDSCSDLRLAASGSTGGSQYSSPEWYVLNPTLNTWYDAYGILTVPSTLTGVVRFRALATYSTATDSNGKSFEVQYSSAIDMGVDASNPLYNLTADQMFQVTQQSGYFEGSKTVAIPLPGSATCNQVNQNGNMALSTNNLANGFTGASISPVSCANKVQTFIATSRYGVFQTSNTCALANHKYFLIANVLAYSNQVHLSGNESTSFHPGDGNYHAIYGFFTPTTDSRVSIQDNTVSGWSNISVKDYFMVWDMGIDSSNPFWSFTAAQMLSMVLKRGYAEGQTWLGGISIVSGADQKPVLDGIVVSAAQYTVFSGGNLRVYTGNPQSYYQNVILPLDITKQYTLTVYPMSGGQTANSNFGVRGATGAAIAAVLLRTTLSSVVFYGANITFDYAYAPVGASFDNYKFAVMLNLGPTAMPWEPGD